MLFDLSRFDKVVQPLLGQHERHQVLFDRIFVQNEVYVRELFRIEPDEPEIELLHLGDIPLERFEDRMVAGRDVGRTFQALLRADQQPVLRSLELRDDLFPAFEGDVPPG